MDEYLQIRLLHRDGLSIRQIAKRLGHSRDTVKKALIEATPRPYTRSKPVVYPKLGQYIPLIGRILKDDESAPRKQRHTAQRIFQRLRDEHGYRGQYDQVRRYVAAQRKRQRETHLLLDHPPGSRLECDFGHIQVDFPEGRRAVPVLLAVWSYSQYPFALALPDETTGSILHGLVCALEFFDCVPAELWWDTRHYIRVMQLLGRHTAAEVAVAIEACLPRQTLRAEFIEQRLARLGATPMPADPLRPASGTVAGPPDQGQAVAANVPLPTAQARVSVQVHVPRPDLRRFDLLLSDDSNLKGATDDVASDQFGDVIEAQPQGTAAADDAERVCPALP